MTTKEKLRNKATRLREEAVQTGQVVMNAPLLVRAAEYAIRFLLGTVLAGASIFGKYAPFGVAMVGASGSGASGFAALLGACFGYLSFLGFLDSLRYIAAAVLTFSVAFAFYDVKLYQKSWFMPVATAFLCGATGFVYLSDGGWKAGDVIFFFTELLFAGTGVYFYKTAFSIWESENDGEMDIRQTVCLLIFGITALISLSQIAILRDISLGRLVALLLVMVVAYRGKMGMGAAVGVSTGLAMDLAGGGTPYYSMSYAFSGLMTGIFWREGKLLAALAFVLSNALSVLWTWDSGVRISGLYEAFMASVIFMLLPESLLRKVDALLCRAGTVGKELSAEQAMRYVKRRLDQTAGAFRALHESLRDSFRTDRENPGNVATVFDRAANRVCRRCALRDSCWQRDYVTTFNALNDATPAMVDRGRAIPSDFPSYFASRCLHLSEFINATNEELTAHLCRRQYQSRLRESRMAVCQQYAELSEILSAEAGRLGEGFVADPVRTKKLRRHLASLGLEGTANCYYDEYGHLQVELDNRPQLRKPDTVQTLSNLLGVSLRLAEQEEGRLLLTQAEPLMAVAGVAARKRDGETVSGDAGAWFRRNDGNLYILLCDGMGSGALAHEDSSLTVRLLERFLQAGMETEAVLRTLNSALALRGEENGGFTTIDLLELNLFTGECVLYKLGAAPTYVKKNNTVSRFPGSALPAGLTMGSSVRPDMIRLHLEPGDCVLLVSDGVIAGSEDDWLREALSSFDGESPKDLARRLIEVSGEKAHAADDRTVMVVKVASRPSACGSI